MIFSEIVSIFENNFSTVIAMFYSIFFNIYFIPYFWANLDLTNQNFASEKCWGKNRLPKFYIWLLLCSNSTSRGLKSSSSDKNRLTRARFWLTEDQNRIPEAQNLLPKAQNGLSESKNLIPRGPKLTPKGRKSTPMCPNTHQKPKVDWQKSNLLPDA